MPSIKTIRAKGFAYENEVANYISYVARIRCTRLPMSGGGISINGAGLADLIGTPGLHLELKRVEKLNIRAALRQATDSVNARTTTDMPVVITRQSRMKTGDSIVALTLDNFLKLYDAYLSQLGVPRTPTDE